MKKSQWIHHGCVVSGDWEPRIFRRRSGQYGNRVDDHQRDAAAHSAQFVADLKADGVEMILTHFYKGFGLVAEEPDMAMAEQLAGHCRQAGLKVGAYVQWQTIVPETLEREEPHCRQWAQRDSAGRYHYPFGAGQSYRIGPCPNHPQFVAWMKKVITACIERLNPDLIHIDNFIWGRQALPDRWNGIEFGCHCPSCQQAFNAYVHDKYSPAQFTELFGYDYDVPLDIPDIRGDPYDFFGSHIDNPAMRELLAFRAHSMAAALREVIDTARSLKPDVAVDVNRVTGLSGFNSYLFANDPSVAYDQVDAFWDEGHYTPQVLDNGAYVGKFRSFKLTRNYDIAQLSYTRNSNTGTVDQKRHLAECLAFNRNVLLYTGSARQSPSACAKDFIRFFQEHRDLYDNRLGVSDLAVVRVGSSLAPSFGDEWAYEMIAEQYLIVRGYAFDIIFDTQIDKLANYRAIVLSGATAIPQAFEDALEAYIRSGGKVLCIGDVGIRNGFHHQHDNTLYERLAAAAGFDDASCSLRQVTELHFASAYPPEQSRGFADDRLMTCHWLLPTNAHQLDAALDDLIGSEQFFRVSPHKGLVFEYYRKYHTYYVHIVDLAGSTGLTCEVFFRPPPGRVPASAELLTLTATVPCVMTRQNDGTVAITIEDAGFDTYGVLTIPC